MVHLKELSGYCVEWAEPGNFLLSRSDRLYHSTDLKPPFREIGRAAAPSWRSLAANFRIAQRLLRFFYYNVIPLDSGDIFVTFDRSVGIIRDGDFIEVTGLARPCRVLRFGCAVDHDGDIFFGEYLANEEKGEMRIYRLPKGLTKAEIAYTFAPGEVRHIHGIYRDETDDRLFCLTGDSDSECRILSSNDKFRSISTLGEGDETWRAVSILFDKNSMYYGTDAEHRDNEIFEFERLSGTRRSIGTVNGTVFYSKKVGDDLFFTTTAENAPSQTENVASLWHIGTDKALKKLASYPKDMLPGGLFLFGTIHFPYKNGFDDRLYFNLVATHGDNEMYCCVK